MGFSSARAGKPLLSGHKSRPFIEQLAEDCLQKVGIDVPVDPLKVAEHYGIEVFKATFNDAAISGVITRKEAIYQIYVKALDNPSRKRFTLAHELGHYFLGHLEKDGEYIDTEVNLYRISGFPGARSQPLEVEANRFAAALLMPAEKVKALYEATPNISLVARKFRVSEEAFAIRLNTLGMI